MKKINFLFGALAALAMGGAVTACSDDDLDKGIDNGVAEVDQTRYLSVAISTPSIAGSRAADDAPTGNFDDGSKNESEVDEIIFVFYDGAGNPTATMKTITGDNLANGWTDNYTDANVTRFWSSVIPVELTQGQTIPSYVMCYVNPIDKTGIDRMTLAEVEAYTRVRIKGAGANGKFAMSNSVYYGNNPISGANDVRMMATPIVESQLFKTPGEAQEAVEAADPEAAGVLQIYVERYAAKIGLNMLPTAIKPYAVNVKDGDNWVSKNIIFTPKCWRPNAIDMKTFITKAFSTGKQLPLDPTKTATFQEMTTAFTNSGMPGEGLTGWNDPDNFRSYWACSPSYFANAYPKVSDNITDVTDNGGAYPYALKYFTYTEFVTGVESTENPAEAGITWDPTNGFNANPGSYNAGGTTNVASSGYFYSRETTASIDNIKNSEMNSKAVVASAVIVGNYKLEGEAANADFYLYGVLNGRPNYYTAADIKAAMIENQLVLFNDEECTDPATTANLFVVEHPKASVRQVTIPAETEGEEDEVVKENVPGRLVTLQLSAVPQPALYFNNNGTIEAIDEDNIDAANRLLWKTVSTAQMFHNGLAFFSIPIRHLGYGKNVNDANAPLTSSPDGASANVYNWGNMRRGDFGVVRNHVYTLNVTEIKGLGTGLRSDDQPIVPPMDPEDYWIAARLNILSWRVVPAQGVIL
ncbi:Mfa1 fimbrilin C-terminal domain-containing protein [uncultured Muribaculum sp.]|uniref:Mfa1 fimbrilin C-terminal domain-containing protein n=1 Tax=uncultured Muribaculum sp. TaxID=1918613 RepID=UPI00259C78FA|nr:Mfa1 fimbrilin C-terminal domain-containing protein [uncultured Muribaculum sp.]